MDEVREFDMEVRDLYFLVRGEMLDPSPPQMANTDGEPIALTTLTFELMTSLNDAFEKLQPLATLDGELHGEIERDPSGAVTDARLSWVKSGNQKMKAWGNTVLGMLKLNGGRLVAEVNSTERAERLKQEISTRLGARARLVDTSVVDPWDELKNQDPGVGVEGREFGLAARMDAIKKDWRDCRRCSSVAPSSIPWDSAMR